MIFIKDLKGLEIVRPSLSEIYNSLKISKKYNLDFDDSLVVSSMMNHNLKTLISLDKDFDQVREIKRIEPRNLKKEE